MLTQSNFYVALVFLFEGAQPRCCLSPRFAWGEGHPEYLVHYDYISRKSKPGYGIRMSERVMEAIIQDYSMDSMAALLK